MDTGVKSLMDDGARYLGTTAHAPASLNVM